MTLEKWELKNLKIKGYLHFDKRVSLNENTKKYIYNPTNVSKHGFYPFIKYEQIFKKFNKYSENKFKEKKRPICYSAHIDQLIYSYYSFLLNNKYNNFLENNSLNNSVIAYRTNLGKNNIHFSKEVFDFIKKSKNSNILIGDFTSFFDNLNHSYLKRKLLEILKTDSLRSDWYNIFKNITKYSTSLLDELEEISPSNKLKKTIFDPLTFQEAKKKLKFKISKNTKNIGIPQGSPISAVLSNVYMKDFDKLLNKLALKYNGLYRRYSDDFILILPESKSLDWITLFLKKATSIVQNLELEPSKTVKLNYNNNVVSGDKSEINYLGFSFDGKYIKIRDKTISKYYKKMYKEIKSVKRIENKLGRSISKKRLYSRFSFKGEQNFITYLQRVNSIFSDNEIYIKKALRTHTKKIKKRLKK